MQDIIDTYRANGIVIRASVLNRIERTLIIGSGIATTHNDQHAGQGGNFSPDLPGNGSVNIYWLVMLIY